MHIDGLLDELYAYRWIVRLTICNSMNYYINYMHLHGLLDELQYMYIDGLLDKLYATQ